MKREELENLAKGSKHVENVEEDILHVDDSMKQSDVLDHLKSATDNGAGKP